MKKLLYLLILITIPKMAYSKWCTIYVSLIHPVHGTILKTPIFLSETVNCTECDNILAKLTNEEAKQDLEKRNQPFVPFRAFCSDSIEEGQKFLNSTIVSAPSTPNPSSSSEFVEYSPGTNTPVSR